MPLERLSIHDLAERLHNFYISRKQTENFPDGLKRKSFEDFLRRHVNRSFDIKAVTMLYPNASPEYIYQVAEETISGKERLFAIMPTYMYSQCYYTDNPKGCLKSLKKYKPYWRVLKLYTYPEANRRIPYHKPKTELLPMPYKPLSIWDGDTTTIKSEACIDGSQCVTRDAITDSFESNDTTTFDVRFTKAELRNFKRKYKGEILYIERKSCQDGSKCLYTIKRKNPKIFRQARNLIKPVLDKYAHYLSRETMDKLLTNPHILKPFLAGNMFRGKLSQIFREAVEKSPAPNQRQTEWVVSFSYSCKKEGCTNGYWKKTYAQHIGQFGREIFHFHRLYKNGDIHTDNFLADFIKFVLPEVMASEKVRHLYKKQMRLAKRNWKKAEEELAKLGVKTEDIERLQALAFGIYKPWKVFSPQRCATMSKSWLQLSTASQLVKKDRNRTVDKRFASHIQLLKLYLGIDLPHPSFPTTMYPQAKLALKAAYEQGNGMFAHNVNGSDADIVRFAIVHYIDSPHYSPKKKKTYYPKLKYFDYLNNGSLNKTLQQVVAGLTQYLTLPGVWRLKTGHHNLGQSKVVINTL